MLQTVADATKIAVEQYHVIQGLGSIGILTAGWGIMRHVHKGQLENVKQFGQIHEAIGTLKTSFEGRMKNTPTLTTCAVQTQSLERLLRKETRIVVDRVQAIVTDHDHAAEKLATQVGDIQRVCDKRHGQNGVT